MFLLISTLVILAAAAVVFYFQKRQTPQLSEKRKIPDETNLRPLFAPEKAQLDRAVGKEAEEKHRAGVQAEQQHAMDELESARRNWLASPSGKTTSAVIKLATEAKRADTFAKIANEILQAHRDGRIERLTNNDVAALLDSHIVLLPVEERGSGALFLIRQQIAELRSVAEPEVG